MLRKIIFLFLLLFSFGETFSQMDFHDRKGEFTVDLFLGGPNLRAIFADDFVGSNGIQKAYVSDMFGPSGMRVAFNLGPIFSLGATGVYDHYTVNYVKNTDTTFYVQRMRLRTYIDFGFHLGNSSKFDHDLNFGVGPKRKSSRYRLNNSSISEERFLDFIDSNLGKDNFFPIAARFNYTFRYYPSEFIGMHVGISVGGPMFHAGLSFNLH